MALPTLVCLKSVYNGKYLRYRHEDVQSHSLLQFAGENVIDPHAQFEIEKSKTFDGLIHIKSRYSNKYLVRWSPVHHWICASANSPDENQSSWSCTLFKPTITEESGTKKVRLFHVQLGSYACLWRIGAPFDSCLYAGIKEPDYKESCDLYTVIDWESISKLPKRVAFKGDNGLYLGAQMFNGQPGLQFSFKDPKDPKVAQQIFPSPDGTNCIKSEYYGKFWRLGDTGETKWIAVDAEDPRGTNNIDTLFRVYAVSTNVVALFITNPTWYVKRLTDGGRESSLSATAPNIDTWSRLEVVDLDK